MTAHKKKLLVLARNEAEARRAGEARGLDRSHVMYARDVGTAERWSFLPMLVDWSLPSHPEGAMLAEFAAAYIWREVPTKWRQGSRRDQ